MRKYIFLLLSVALLAACGKDPIESSKHPLSEEQQKAVATFVGEWDGVATSYFIGPPCLSFGRQSDTNVQVYSGGSLAFQHQGEVVLRTIEWHSAGNDTIFTPCWYYVDQWGLTISLFRQSDSSKLWKHYGLDIVSPSQIKVQFADGYNQPWLTLNKR